MKESSLLLIRIRGIDVRIHVTFPIILFIVAVQYGILSGFNPRAAINGIFVTLLLFVLVLAHEFGHSWAAMHYGIGVSEIVLLPLGGIAALEKDPREPRQEFVIAAAGPVVNFALGGILAIAGLLLDYF
ncbi:MAG TPA: site-2 protease family protein, partial [Anaerolineales bacterium]|nr:site-2 protease family protein [Anaerolineales bacterium]